MNHAENLITSLDMQVKAASESRAIKSLQAPLHYFAALLYKNYLYSWFRKDWEVKVNTFYGSTVTITFPGNFDIYQYGVKMHDSEVRLAKLMIHYLQPGDCFMDIGAHIGYYSLLGSLLVGRDGKVMAVDPASRTYHILQENISGRNNISAFECAIGDTNGQVEFLYFPGLYSEDSRLPYGNAGSGHQDGETYLVSMSTLSAFTERHQYYPNWIKIDVEGGEAAVISGGTAFLREYQPVIVMEFIPKGEKGIYLQAMEYLFDLGYVLHRIDKDGHPQPVVLEHYLMTSAGESDNLVFLPSGFDLK